MLDQPSLALVLRLPRQGWSVGQIAALLQVDEATVFQAGRDTSETRAPAPAPPNPAAESDTRLRLSPDARRLELWLPPDALSIPSEQIAARITEECAEIGLSLEVGADVLRQRMRTWVYGAWLSILECEPPTPPVQERIEVLVPVRLAGRRRKAPIRPHRHRDPRQARAAAGP